MLAGKHILLGVTGGIAAIKIPLLIREFKKQKADVRVVMSRAAKEFVTPLSLSTLSGHTVITEMFPEQTAPSVASSTWHIELGMWADVTLIAPATANFLAKLSHGIADDALSTLMVALRCPVILSPAMDDEMWRNPITQRNISSLKEVGYCVLPPEEGELASGLIGMGRLPEIPSLVQFTNKILEKSNRDFHKKKILITAGPTYEPIDAVRFISNRSSGRMGFALANASALRGADVTLISGPSNLQTPRNVKRVDVETSEEMFNAVTQYFSKSDVIIMSAAVSDFTPVKSFPRKLKKENISSDTFSLELKKNKDILTHLGQKKRKGQFLVGFALETDNELANAKRKLQEKNLDLIVCNNPLEEGAGFTVETNKVTLIDKNGKIEKFPVLQKFDVANEILDSVLHRTKKYG
ncbi:MAG: bifunctional phosphopantothenoylcysteine decarboxylase/phosphopantothenate--cysteine ligase CoaBC [Ignavibacteriales bacterium]|nr:bifunctional phosphopantothenoylcysteine decarboxylase/phosphopantothenate--cysteine ligase CoaBC [Ignavibacteriales bacterium]